MPSLKDLLAVKSLPGYEQQTQTPPTPPVVQPGGPGSNPFRRCPLPPFNAGPDTLRQFEENGKIPARRVIPLPAQVAGTGASVTNVTNVTTTASGSSSSSSTTSPTSASVAITVPAMVPGQVYTTSVQIAKGFQLLSLTASNAVEVRLYGTSLSQTIDIARATDTAPAFEVTMNMMTDVVFDTSPYLWSWQNRIVANADDPQTKFVYVTVINYGTSGISGTTVTINYVPTQS
jgi:hypothetical protein